MVWPWQKSPDQIYAKGMAKKNSENAIIANYQNQTQQIKDMKWVLICAIAAGTTVAYNV